jgi:hypothetical protein
LALVPESATDTLSSDADFRTATLEELLIDLKRSLEFVREPDSQSTARAAFLSLRKMQASGSLNAMRCSFGRHDVGEVRCDRETASGSGWASAALTPES